MWTWTCNGERQGECSARSLRLSYVTFRAMKRVLNVLPALGLTQMSHRLSRELMKQTGRKAVGGKQRSDHLFIQLYFFYVAPGMLWPCHTSPCWGVGGVYAVSQCNRLCSPLSLLYSSTDCNHSSGLDCSYCTHMLGKSQPIDFTQHNEKCNNKTLI